MKKFAKFALSVFAVALMFSLSFLLADINADMDIIPIVSAAEIVQSGSCGTNVTYTLDSEGTLTISGVGRMKDYNLSLSPWYASRNSIKNIIISDGVTSIGICAFSDCCNLQNIYLPDSILSIGNSAFIACSKLQNITIPQNVTSIGTWAFSDCSNLQNIYLPDSIAYIGTSAFSRCNSLKNITIPYGVENIEDYMFSYCYNLESVSIPNSVKNIGTWAFMYCQSLQEITIPNSVTTVGESAFGECSSLQSVTISDSITSIKDWAFSNCNNLQSITIPSGVDYIANYIFYGCSNLKYISLPASVKSIESSAFAYCYSLTEIEYCGTKEQWSSVEISEFDNNVLYNALHHAKIRCHCNHKNVIEIKGVESTCSTIGYTEGLFCNDCEEYISGYTKRAIDSNAHKWDSGTITTTATCKVNGVKTYTCQHNSAHTKTENLGVNASNHVNTKNVAEAKATCTTKGYTAGVYCNDCQQYISGHAEIAINVDAHKWDNGSITTTATCNVSGVKTYTCQHNASHKKTDNLGINASNHVNTKTVPVTPATFDKVGYTEGVFCNDCQKYISGHKEIPRLTIAIGDLDGNGKITAADARLALRSSVGLENLSASQKKAADADGNGVITAADARLILRASVGLEEPKEWLIK